MRIRTLLPALALACLPLALTACSTTKVVTTGPTADTISVTGSGTAMSAPDRVTVRFGVDARDADPRRAMSLVSTASNKLTAALRKAGIAEKDLQTGSVRLDPQYRYDRDGTAHVDTYLASVDVSALGHDPAKAGEIIVAGTDAGANRVNGISFDLDEKNGARYEASAEAVRDARAKATAIAKAAGRALGDVVSIGQPQQTAIPYAVNGFDAAKATGAAIPQISPGQLEASENVQVVFALK